MSRTVTTTDDQLTSALHALGVSFIMGGGGSDSSLHKQAAQLIAALAESNDSRLRLALIPLFVERPEFAAHVRNAAKNLNASARLTLQCYYSAAVWLAQKHRLRLEAMVGEKASLPDVFSRELGMQVKADPEKNLELLAKRHQELSGVQVNWLGTYHHAAQIWLKGLELQHGSCGNPICFAGSGGTSSAVC